MNNEWALNEFNLANIGDQRLNKRLVKIAEKFANSPESPINQACNNWAATKAAYRFFRNDNVAYKDITAGHAKMTKQRCTDFSTVLAIQDTSYFTYSQHPATKGLCSLSKKKGFKQKELVTLGLIMHSTLAVSADGLPLGLLDQNIYSRPALSKEMIEEKKRVHNTAIPTEKKESNRWLESLRKVNNIFESTSVNIITVCDRESDIYDFFRLADTLKTQVLVRARHDRKVNKKSLYQRNTGIKLWDLMKKKEKLGTIIVKIPKQKNQPARIAKCQIKICKFEMTPPCNHVELPAKKLPTLSMYAIYLYENNRSKKIQPIDWMLLTNIAITNKEQALEKIQWYCIRWRIEVFHKILKSGLKVEDCRLSTSDRLIRYLAVMSIVAWRIFWITIISRVSPTVTCYFFLSDIEWKILYLKFSKKIKIPKKPPSIKQCIIWIAMLGGYLNRKSDGDPGITHVWRGMKKFSNMIEGVELSKDICG